MQHYTTVATSGCVIPVWNNLRVNPLWYGLFWVAVVYVVLIGIYLGQLLAVGRGHSPNQALETAKAGVLWSEVVDNESVEWPRVLCLFSIHQNTNDMQAL
jgi:hypothetical protein